MMQASTDQKQDHSNGSNGAQPLREDARWKLIERIANSSSLQKSARLKDLLRFLAEKSLTGEIAAYTEQRIGSAVFGKPEDYSVVEDSSVRVHVRQLRLRLHEYFDGEGRGESSTIEIPKGSYQVVFHPSPAGTTTQPVSQAILPQSIWQGLLPWSLTVLFLATTAISLFHRTVAPASAPPWPLNEVFGSGNRPVQMVVADVNYGMGRLINEQPVSLDKYLSPDYRGAPAFSEPGRTRQEARANNYLSESLLTSYADLAVATTIVRISGNSRDQLIVRAARELRPRDLEGGSAILIGSPSSNPWTFYYADRLNFQEKESVIGESPKYFQNLHPRPGEETTYSGMGSSGGSGEVYATVALLPSLSGHGNVLLVQGLQQEGTEAAGLFLADPESRRKLQAAVGTQQNSGQPTYFEVLLKAQSVAGAPSSVTIVATRVIQP